MEFLVLRCRSPLSVTVLLLGAAAALGCASAPSAGVASSRVLGATEIIHVVEADLDFLAVVDTGAHRTSIHALDMRIPDPAPEMHDNIGKRVEFRVVNELGRSRKISAVIVDVTAVRTSHGAEWRYIVPLHLRWRGIEREVHVNLRDRTPMTYKLLVGRDWIRGFLVDVERN